MQCLHFPAWEQPLSPAWGRLRLPCLGTFARALPGHVCSPCQGRLPVPCLGTFASALHGHVCSMPGTLCQFPDWERLPVPCLGMILLKLDKKKESSSFGINVSKKKKPSFGIKAPSTEHRLASIAWLSYNHRTAKQPHTMHGVCAHVQNGARTHIRRPIRPWTNQPSGRFSGCSFLRFLVHVVGRARILRHFPVPASQSSSRKGALAKVSDFFKRSKLWECATPGRMLKMKSLLFVVACSVLLARQGRVAAANANRTRPFVEGAFGLTLSGSVIRGEPDVFRFEWTVPTGEIQVIDGNRALELNVKRHGPFALSQGTVHRHRLPTSL